MASARDQIERPTVPTLIARAVGDYIGRVRRQGARIRRSWQRAVLYGLGQTQHDLITFARWVIQQVWADEAVDDRLDVHGDLFGGLTRDAATAATSAQLRFTGVAATNIPAGTEVERPDGVAYTTDALAVIGADGTVDVAATCSETGINGNLDAGAELTLTAAIAGVDPTATTIDGFAGGADEESNDGFRTRVIARIRDEAEGGTVEQYEAWAREALAAVRSVWIVVGSGDLNQRTLYFTVDGSGAGIVPTGAQITTVSTYVQARRCLTQDLTVGSDMTTTSALLTISLDPDPADPDTDTSDNRTAVEAALNALWAREAGNRNADGTLTIENSKIRNAIGEAVDVFTLTDVDGDGTGLSDVTASERSVVVHSITWV